jgi:hypothetical protein
VFGRQLRSGSGKFLSERNKSVLEFNKRGITNSSIIVVFLSLFKVFNGLMNEVFSLSEFFYFIFISSVQIGKIVFSLLTLSNSLVVESVSITQILFLLMESIRLSLPLSFTVKNLTTVVSDIGFVLLDVVVVVSGLFFI